jgi:hypothetical protein
LPRQSPPAGNGFQPILWVHITLNPSFTRPQSIPVFCNTLSSWLHPDYKNWAAISRAWLLWPCSFGTVNLAREHALNKACLLCHLTLIWPSHLHLPNTQNTKMMQQDQAWWFMHVSRRQRLEGLKFQACPGKKLTKPYQQIKWVLWHTSVTSAMNGKSSSKVRPGQKSETLTKK